MIPQKSNILYKELSETLNHNEFLIEEVIDFYYSEIKKILSELKYPRINLEGLGHFVAKPGLVKKSIPKYRSILEKHDTSTYGAYFNKKMIENKLDLLIELEHQILIEENRKLTFKKNKYE
jgi:hypothetical protein